MHDQQKKFSTLKEICQALTIFIINRSVYQTDKKIRIISY